MLSRGATLDSISEWLTSVLHLLEDDSSSRLPVATSLAAPSSDPGLISMETTLISSDSKLARSERSTEDWSEFCTILGVSGGVKDSKIPTGTSDPEDASECSGWLPHCCRRLSASFLLPCTCLWYGITGGGGRLPGTGTRPVVGLPLP